MSTTTPQEWHVPAFAARIASRLPQWPHSMAVAGMLNLLIRRKLDPEALARLEGKVVRVEVRDAGIVVSVACRDSTFRPTLRSADADVTISASARDLFRLAARQEDADTLFFARHLTIEGDTELGLVVKNMLDALDLTELLPSALRR